MAFLNVENVEIKGIAACVPERVEENRNYSLMSAEEIERYIKATGVERRHCAIHDGSICASDLCYTAAEKLISELDWDKSEIDILIFVSQTADYKLPATACVLQDRLKLSTECIAYDIPLGCSGFIYGLGIISNLLSSGTFRKALLMVGNTQSVYSSYEDRTMYLLLGDAGTVTALEYNPTIQRSMNFHYMTDGSGKDFVMVPDGGSRNPISQNSFVMEDYGNGIKRTRLHEKMDGDEVFSYAIRNVPKSFKMLSDYFNLNVDNADYILLHQANKFLCETLRKKLKLPAEKVPYNIHEYGNTSGSTIPLLMVTNLQEQLQSKEMELFMTTIGVGFSLGSARIFTSKIVCPDLMTL